MEIANSARYLAETAATTDIHGADAHGSDAGASHGHHIPSVALITFWIFGSLFLCGLLREINKKTKFPYTPMLVFLGIFLGCYTGSLGVFGQAIEEAHKITAEGILMIFIPTLIFESAFNSDWYVFKREMWQILILAGPGVLMGAILLAMSFKMVLFYTTEDLDWAEACMLGSILSTTDPVAVVALLKELGASTRFNTLIEGESLLNDGTGMVFYLLFAGVVKQKTGGAPVTMGGVVKNFIFLAIGGPLLGIIMGAIVGFWLKKLVRDEVLSSTIMFIACYMSFFIAEHSGLHLSGILAVVAMGLFMSAFGRIRIHSESEHAVHTVWSFIQYNLESLVFLLTGIIIGYDVFYKGGSTIDYSDWIRLFMFYGCMIGVRYAMLFTFWPILNKVGYPISPREIYVIGWGGLRGALGLCLALLVKFDPGFSPRVQDLALFYMAGMATLTLLVNGTTCSFLVQVLGIIVEPPIKAKIYRSLVKDMVTTADHTVQQLQNDPFLAGADWSQVNDLIGVDDLVAKVADKKKMTKESLMVRKSTYGGLASSEIHEEIRYRMLRILKGQIWERYEEGECSGDCTKLLSETCDIAFERPDLPVDIWTNIYTYFTDLGNMKYMFKFTGWPIIGPFCTNYINNHITFIYESVQIFIVSIDTLLDNENQVLLPAFNKQIMEEFAQNRRHAEQYMFTLCEMFPELVKAIRSKRAANIVLAHQKVKLSEKLHDGEIDQKEYNKFRNEIDDMIYAVANYQPPWGEITFSTIIVDFPLFKTLTSEELNAILSASKERKFKDGDPLFEAGKPIEGLFVLLSGQVDEKITSKINMRKGVGSILSYANIMNPNLTKNKVTAIAKSEVLTNSIPWETLTAVLRKNAKFREMCCRNSLLTLCKLYPTNTKPLSGLEERYILNVAFSGEYKAVPKNKKISFPKGGFIFSGEIVLKDKNLPSIKEVPSLLKLPEENPTTPKTPVKEAETSDPKRFKDGYVVPPGDSYVTAKDVIVLKFATPLDQIASPSKGQGAHGGHGGHGGGHGKAQQSEKQAPRKHSLASQMEREKEIDEEFDRKHPTSKAKVRVTDEEGNEYIPPDKADQHREKPEPKSDDEDAQADEYDIPEQKKEKD